MENLSKLIELLQQEKKIYKGLLDISKKKKKVIIEGNVSELEKITKVEQALVLNMGKLEETVENIINALKNDLSITENEDGETNLSTIIDVLSGNDKTDLDTLRNEIYDIVQELSDMNQHNSELIKNSLDYINFSVNLFSNSQSGTGGGYEQSGDIQMNQRSLFDKKL